ncbi:hypothetical protein LAWI1_G007546 [Lachnellula willkommii]|uniref:Uncharacterized protein n=1 Tax=Lachnellula willkommii TaxID=215461 RepID=A0A559M549_9HELO|nr:hypothetical protein LAWI1_G007546 [Lachnellula willkommii]
MKRPSKRHPPCQTHRNSHLFFDMRVPIQKYTSNSGAPAPLSIKISLDHQAFPQVSIT